MSLGVRPVREGRTLTRPPLPPRVSFARSRSALVPGPPPSPGRGPPHLATRRSPSRGCGAGPLRLGCVGPPGAHVSSGQAARGAGVGREPRAQGGRAKGSGSARLDLDRRRPRRCPRRCHRRVQPAAPRPLLPGAGGGARGARGAAEGGRGGSAPPPPGAPVVAARVRLGAGDSGGRISGLRPAARPGGWS